MLLLTGSWFVVSLGLIPYLFLKSRAAESVRATPAPSAQSQKVASPSGSASPAADSRKDPALQALIYRYYPTKLSQGYEEAFMRDYFQDREGGFFVDVGANHYKVRSTTHYLDIALGWEGIAIDPIVEFAAEYEKYRPRTRFLPFFVGEKSDEDVDFYVVKSNHRLSTGDRELVQRKKHDYETRKVRTTTLTDLLDAHEVQQIDLLKMDIEMWEPPALRGFDIDRFKPRLVVIEDHPPVSQAIHAYFADHAYALIESYTKWDGRNAYFIPKEDLPAFINRPTLSERLEARKRKSQSPPPETAQ